MPVLDVEGQLTIQPCGPGCQRRQVVQDRDGDIHRRGLVDIAHGIPAVHVNMMDTCCKFHGVEVEGKELVRRIYHVNGYHVPRCVQVRFPVGDYSHGRPRVTPSRVIDPPDEGHGEVGQVDFIEGSTVHRQVEYPRGHVVYYIDRNELLGGEVVHGSYIRAVKV